jgi:hypothetical protein
MSKYTIKLEQLVSSDNFGDLVLTIQYDFQGAKIISVKGEKISMELSSQVTPMLNMFNFCLTKGIPTHEVVDQMLVGTPSTQMDKLLAVVLNSVKEAPARIQDIKQESVIEISPVILKHLS